MVVGVWERLERRLARHVVVAITHSSNLEISVDSNLTFVNMLIQFLGLNLTLPSLLQTCKDLSVKHVPTGFVIMSSTVATSSNSSNF